MNKILISFISIYLFGMKIGYNQNNTFSKTIDLGGLEIGWSILIENDGYLIGGGTSLDTPVYHRLIALTKVNFDGEAQWIKKYGSSDIDLYNGYNGSLKKISVGGYVMGGSFVNLSDNSNYLLLIRFNNSGDTLFTERFGTINEFDAGREAVETSYGGFAILGETNSYGAGLSDFYLVKTDSQGNFLWQKTYGGSNYEHGSNIAVTPDSGFILSGFTKSYGKGGYDGWLIKTDSLGNMQRNKTYGTPREDCGAWAYPFMTGEGFYMTHCIDTIINTGDYHLAKYLAKLDDSGAIIWRCFFNGIEERGISNFRQINNGNYIVAGTLIDTSNSLFGWIAKVNSTGSILWERRYKYKEGPLPPQFADSYFYDIQQTPDEGFILSGFTFDQNQDIWLVKLDSMGCLEPGCYTSDEAIDISPQYSPSKIYPNPFSDIATLEVNLQNQPIKPATCNIYDEEGKFIISMQPESFQKEKLKFKVQLNGFSKGVYLYKVVSNYEVIGRGKMILK